MEKKKFEITYIRKGQEKTIHYLQFQLLQKDKILYQSKQERQIGESHSKNLFLENNISSDVCYLHIKNASFSCATSFICPSNTLLYLEDCIVENKESLYFEGGNVIIERLKGDSSLVFKKNEAVDFLCDKEKESDIVNCLFDQVENLQLSGNLNHVHLGSFSCPIKVKNIRIKSATNVFLDKNISSVHRFVIEDSTVRAVQFQDYDHLEIRNSSIFGDVNHSLRIDHEFDFHHSVIVSPKIYVKGKCYSSKDKSPLVLTNIREKGKKSEIEKFLSCLSAVEQMVNEVVRWQNKMMNVNLDKEKRIEVANLERKYQAIKEDNENLLQHQRVKVLMKGKRNESIFH